MISEGGKMSEICEMPKIGFGTWKLKNDEETERVIKDAIQAGYSLFDTASSYQNEEAIGNAFSKEITSRDCLWISGKLWNDDRENVMSACQKTIQALQCDYLDLYLMHWPVSKAVHDDWVEMNHHIWLKMEQTVKEGFVKHIGVSNFKINQLTELLKETKTTPFVNQIECHIGCYPSELISFCKEHGILVQAWSPLGSGKLLKKAEVIQMAEKYQKTPAQLCLRWCVQNQVIPIVKSTEIDRMKSNLDIFQFEISQEDMTYLNSIQNLACSGLDSETLTLFG